VVFDAKRVLDPKLGGATVAIGRLHEVAVVASVNRVSLPK
jgi:hypothetical protein